MRLSIFKKADKLVDKVVYEGEGKDMAFFSFKDIDIEDPPKVIILLGDEKTMLGPCTCSHCSVHGGVHPNVLCSYKIAVLKRLPRLKDGNPKQTD